MKKKLFLLMALLCCFVLAVGILAACNGDDPDDLGEPGDEDVITYGRYYAVTPSSSSPVWLQLNPDFTWEMSVGISTSGTYEITSPYEMIFYSGDMQVCIARYDAGAGAVTLEIEGNTLTFYMDQFGGEDGEPKFTVTFRVDGNIYDSQTQLDAGDLVAPPEVEPQSGKYLDGWYTDPNFTEKWDFDNNMVASSLDLYARWLTGEIEAVYSPGWMRESAELDVEKLTLQLFVEFDHPDLPSVIDFDSICQIEEGVEMRLFKDAVCSEEISLELPLSEAAFADGDNLFYLQTYFPDGTAARVYTVNLFKQYPVIVYAHDPYGDVFFSIQFDAPYFGPLYSDGQKLETIEQWAEFYRQQGYAHGTFDGYTLTGWYVDDEEYNSTGMVKQDAHVYPICTPNEYTVTLDAEEGSVSTNTVTVTYDADFTFPVAVREYYQFDGWFLADGTRITDANGQSTSGWTLLNDTTVYAKYTIDRYNVLLTADTDGAKVIGTGEYDVLSEVTVQAVSPLGYDFVGWYEGDTLRTTDLEYTFTVPVDGVELTAKWTVKDEMAGYIFTATDSVCHITGVTDTTVTELYIPEYVTDIADTAFSDCEVLERITVSEDNPDYYSQSGVLYSNNQIEYVPLKVSGHVVIPEGVTRIDSYEFEGHSELTAITIPNSVTFIGWYAFNGCSGLTSITIPDSVTTIEEYAFKDCIGLSSVTIGNGVTIIARGAFSGCTGMTSVTIPDSVTSIGQYAFQNCSSLESITLPFVGLTKDGTSYTHFGYTFGASSSSSNDDYVPDSLKEVTITGGTIGDYAFRDCSGLTSVNIGEGVTNIESDAFSGCTGLTSIEVDAKNAAYASVDGVLYNKAKTELIFIPAAVAGDITIPHGVTSIGHSAFDGRSALTSISIPDSVTDIEDYAFRDCIGLTSITIPDSVTRIRSSAFEGCINITSATMPTIAINAIPQDSLQTVVLTSGESIGIYAFSGCSSLTSVTISDSVTSIGYNAFADCSSLTSITIPDSVTSIGSSAFSGCSSLESITLPFVGAAKDGTEDTHFGYTFGALSYSYNDDYVPASLTEVIVTGKAGLGDYAFYGCTALTTVTIGNSVTRIGANAFAYCTAEIIWGDAPEITEFGDYAFVDYLGANITIPDSVTRIGDYAFYDYVSLISVTIPDGMMSIGDSAFEECRSLTSVTIPDSVTSMGKRVFFNCAELTSVTIGTGLTSIEDSAFDNCRSMTSVTIGKGVTSIGAGAFKYCYNLPSVTIPGGVMSIGDEAFSACSSLNYVTIEDGVMSIGDDVFFGCSGLTSVTIGNGVTSIGAGAFSGCSGLTYIVIPDSVTSMGAGVFSGCTSLGSITIPFVGAEAGKTSSDIYQYPFGYIFGTESYEGGTAVEQYYYGNSTSSTTSTTYYIPSSLGSVTVTGGNILYGAFYNLHLPWSIKIHDSVTSIGDYAFYSCYKMHSFTIPDSVTSIGVAAFSDSGLSDIIIPDGVTSIEERVFENCRALGHISISHNVTSIGDYALSGCSFTYITIPESVTSIGDYALSGCHNLSYVTVPDDVTSIGFGAFEGCSSLNRIAIPFVGATKDGAENTHLGYIFGAYDYSDNEDYVPASLRNVFITGKSGSIRDHVFSGCSGLTSVTIPDSVTSIGEYAFYGCSSLISITMPDGVTSIGSSAFSGCGSLDSITIPDGVTSIEGNTFSGCSSLTYVGVPDSVTSIGLGAFEGCSLLNHIAIPFVGATKDGTSNTHFGYIFGASSDRYNADYVPASLRKVFITGGTSIGDRAFYGCSGLTYVNIGNGVMSIGSYAFYNCSSLTSVTMPDGVTSIGDRAFSGCGSLDSITIPDSVTSIGDYAFEGCSGLTSITIPDSVTSIGWYAFNGCRGLTSITIGNGVTSIGQNAFYNCNKLIEVYNKSSLDIRAGKNGNGYVGYYAKNVYTEEDGSWFTDTADEFRFFYDGEQGYLIGYYGSETELELPASFTAYNGTLVESYAVYDSAFYRHSNLTSVIISDSVTSVGRYAFQNCSGLTSVVIPDSVTSIGNDVFYDCSSLTSIIVAEGNPIYHSTGNCIIETDSKTLVVGCKVSMIPNDGSVTRIGTYAFSGCRGLTSITIPDSVTSIGNYAFKGCNSLTAVYITDIAAWCGIGFADSSSNPLYYAHDLYLNDELVTDLVIPAGVTSIEKYAFYNCSNLISITIPDSVTSIENSAFRGCTNLIEKENGVSYVDGWAMDFDESVSSVELREGTRGIAANVFDRCTGLTSVTIPDSVTSIGEYAFYGCSGLTSVTIPDSVTSIGRSAFSGCSGLTSVTIPDSVTSIGDYAFEGCSGLDSVTIGDGVTSIGDYAFSGCSALTSVTIPDSVTNIGNWAFRGCSKWTSIYYTGDMSSWLEKDWHSSVMSSGRTLYLDGNKVEGAITIPDGATSIPSFAFAYQTGITSVTIPHRWFCLPELQRLDLCHHPGQCDEHRGGCLLRLQFA